MIEIAVNRAITSEGAVLGMLRVADQQNHDEREEEPGAKRVGPWPDHQKHTKETDCDRADSLPTHLFAQQTRCHESHRDWHDLE